VADAENSARQRAARMPESVGALPDPVSTRIVDEIRWALPGRSLVEPAGHLETDLGLDSMERVELLVHLTTVFAVEVPDGEAQALHTVGDLIAALRSRYGAHTDVVRTTVARMWEGLRTARSVPSATPY